MNIKSPTESTPVEGRETQLAPNNPEVDKHNSSAFGKTEMSETAAPKNSNTKSEESLTKDLIGALVTDMNNSNQGGVSALLQNQVDLQRLISLSKMQKSQNLPPAVNAIIGGTTHG